MTDTEIRQLYEKLYFHEVEAREKIHARLQLPVTLIVAIAGAMAFLFQNANLDFAYWSPVRVMFGLFLLASSLALTLGIVWFAGAFYDNVYYFLPTSEQTAAYLKQLEDTYKEFPNSKELVSTAFDTYITDKYVEYGSFNAVVNDRRSGFIHRCNGAIIATVILLASAYISYAIGDLDKRKTAEVVITKPVDVRLQDSRK